MEHGMMTASLTLAKALGTRERQLLQAMLNMSTHNKPELVATCSFKRLKRLKGSNQRPSVRRRQLINRELDLTNQATTM